MNFYKKFTTETNICQDIFEEKAKNILELPAEGVLFLSLDKWEPVETKSFHLLPQTVPDRDDSNKRAHSFAVVPDKGCRLIDIPRRARKPHRGIFVILL